ncbi:MAG: ParB/RepB/Spo0J family partition protein [Chloroflexota bacterium]
MPKPDFRGQAAARLAQERTQLSPGILSLLGPEPGSANATATNIRSVPVDRIEANPDQPRLTFHEETLQELAASIAEHGVLQPVLVRPMPEGRYQLIAGERRWRASRIAGLAEIPAIVEQIDDETALEIAIIENLQREDLSPLDEAIMYERMTTEHGYSLRKLAQKLGKDKGYIENRLRLADAPPEVRELVSLRKDTLSHAYELMKVTDPKKRQRLARQVAAGELSLVKLKERIDGRAPRTAEPDAPEAEAPAEPSAVAATPPAVAATAADTERPVEGDPLTVAKTRLADALEDLSTVLREQDALRGASDTDRQNFAKYLTIAKLRLENAIAVVRAGEPKDRV